MRSNCALEEGRREERENKKKRGRVGGEKEEEEEEKEKRKRNESGRSHDRSGGKEKPSLAPKSQEGLESALLAFYIRAYSCEPGKLNLKEKA